MSEKLKINFGRRRTQGLLTKSSIESTCSLIQRVNLFRWYQSWSTRSFVFCLPRPIFFFPPIFRFRRGVSCEEDFLVVLKDWGVVAHIRAFWGIQWRLYKELKGLQLVLLLLDNLLVWGHNCSAFSTDVCRRFCHDTSSLETLCRKAEHFLLHIFVVTWCHMWLFVWHASFSQND